MHRAGRLVAANTDVGAIALLLTRLYEAKARMGSVTLLGNGGALAHDAEDLGFMYSTGFFDPDGHGWGPFFMDMASFEAQQHAEPATA